MENTLHIVTGPTTVWEKLTRNMKCLPFFSGAIHESHGNMKEQKTKHSVYIERGHGRIGKMKRYPTVSCRF